jgi:hypothetical protein
MASANAYKTPALCLVKPGLRRTTYCKHKHFLLWHDSCFYLCDASGVVPKFSANPAKAGDAKLPV